MAPGPVTQAPIVCDSSALIGLEQIGRLDLLLTLFGSVFIPPAVRRETSGSVRSQPWLIERPLARPMRSDLRRSTLGPGEVEAIGLALEMSAGAVVLDDRMARRLTQRFGLRVTGTAGVLVAAKLIGILDAVRPELDALLRAGFFLSRFAYDRAIDLAGE